MSFHVDLSEMTSERINKSISGNAVVVKYVNSFDTRYIGFVDDNSNNVMVIENESAYLQEFSKVELGAVSVNGDWIIEAEIDVNAEIERIVKRVNI